MRYVGLSPLHRCLEVTFDSGGFLIFCGARVTGFSSVLQHINERKNHSSEAPRSELAARVKVDCDLRKLLLSRWS